MYQTDYILRLIEDAARFLAGILSAQKIGKQKDALEMIYTAYQSVFAIDKNEIETKSIQDIILHFQENNKNSMPLIELFSDFLQEEANVTNSLSLYQKSFELLSYIDQNDKETFSLSRKNKLEKLSEILKH